ncbi:MAG: response regulator [Candidatus Omnitrophota bacterium]
MSKNFSILVIDDNPTDLKLISSLLANNGYDVSSAQEAPAGIELAMQMRPDLIILDVMMPIINGYNICRLIKDQAEYSGIPIVLLTSRSNEEDHRIGREAGADAYISKPFDSEGLLCTIKDLLNNYA